ncbi:MAG: response regulator [Dorea sp.]|jgi:two-component system chemotaxis response regulator CheY|nr:response regulator [Dorea sp.]
MGKRIMIVDDSRVIEVQMAKLLEGTEYEVAAYCKDGEEALARYGEVLPDLVTMDIIMPGMDGLEAAEAILEDYPEARIVMVSSLAYEDTIQEADEIGAKNFVFKPLDKKQLLNAFEKAFA